MADLDWFQIRIVNMANRKGWKNDLAWLGLGCFKEMGELWQSIEAWHDKEAKLREKGTKEANIMRARRRAQIEIESEFAGVMHYVLQLMYRETGQRSLDKALLKEIERNETHKKKTYEDGKIVRK